MGLAERFEAAYEDFARTFHEKVELACTGKRRYPTAEVYEDMRIAADADRLFPRPFAIYFWTLYGAQQGR